MRWLVADVTKYPAEGNYLCPVNGMLGLCNTMMKNSAVLSCGALSPLRPIRFCAAAAARRRASLERMSVRQA